MFLSFKDLEVRMSSASAAASPTPGPRLFQTIDSMSEQELDALPHGAIQLDIRGTVLKYNAYEGRLAGLTKEQVVGKNFFRQVAPCTDVQEFYGRFREGVVCRKLHCKFRYRFTFKANPRDVTVTLFYSERDETVWVFVQPLDSPA
jgi:photoactive yellow protein